ncbi:EAL domain-containing protein [Paracoccus onubensis]|uniref:EAL domain-containing protein n=1 Tax=Paracoccus onubensis TaxID=1675788 RepID=A0A418SPR1_9RHOB|nr:EAL domain-containing protein [Paracoccus onubensis]
MDEADVSDTINRDDSPLNYVISQQSRLTLSSVRDAVERGKGFLAFQPIVQARQSQRIAYYEGLIRVADETGRIVPLKDFMPYAETTELGRQIDCLALSLGLQALEEEPALRLAINMSARSIGHPEWNRILYEGVRRNPQTSERLILEITESSAMELPQQVNKFMREIQQYGVSLALDDFGAGYTSFRYLRDFCFDMVKIDGQFVRRIAKQPDNQVLTRALQSIALHFDMFTVAESVETADDAAFLIELGVDCLQGFYFGAPTLAPPWKKPPAAARY